MTEHGETKQPAGQDPDETISDVRDIEEIREQAAASQESDSATAPPGALETISDFAPPAQPIEDTPPPRWASPDSATLESPQPGPAVPPPTAIAPPAPVGPIAPPAGQPAPPPVTPGLAMSGQGPTTPGGGFMAPPGMQQGPPMPGGPGGPGPGGPGAPGPYAPQPYGQPGMPYQQPGFGGVPGFAPPAPPQKRNNSVLIATIAGAAAVLVLLVSVGIVIAANLPQEDPKVTAVKRLTAAASALSGAKAIRYSGSITSGTDQMNGDFKVTSGGRTSASVTWGGSQATFIMLDDNLFVKSDSTYWKTVANYFPQGSANSVDASKWGKRPTSAVNFDFKSYLTPANLAGKVRGVTKFSITSKPINTTTDGAKALEVVTIDATYFVTADGPAKVLRVASNGFPTYSLDVDVPGGADATTELRGHVNELKDSFDTTAFVSGQKIQFGTCDANSCTVKQTVTVTRSPAPTSQAPITAHYTLSRNQDGSGKVDECSATGTPGTDGTVQLSCTVNDSNWTNYASGGTNIWAAPDAYTAVGASSDDITSMLSGLDKESTV